MSLKKRILSLVLSAALLLAPAASFAEEAVSSYYAGELTTSVIADSYAYGSQINLNAALGLELAQEIDNEKLAAIADLIDRCEVQMSVYDDFGTVHIHSALSLAGTELFDLSALVMEDGSVQIMTNLTGSLVLALPAGSVTDGMLNLESLAGNEYDEMSNEEGAVRELPLAERLKVTGNDLIALLINHLLGWVSYVQMEEGDLYTFDDEYLEATEERDPVAQRMIGKIDASSFNALMWNIATTICDDEGDFQDAIADLLASLGVTRYQMRVFIDNLLTEETIDPALDWVSTSYYIIENKDDSPCTYDDVAYFFKKLKKSSFRVYENSTDAELGMVVSYDDFGSMVGFDADVPKFSHVLPYEGSFSYSKKTDDYWQATHTARGELQVYGDHRIIGDLKVHDGEDVNGVSESYLDGTLDVLNQRNGTSTGIDVDAKLGFEVGVEESGAETENFEGHLTLRRRTNGTAGKPAGVVFSGVTTATPETFATYATAMAEVTGVATLVADMSIEKGEYEEMPFVGGQAVDLTALDDAKISMITEEITKQAIGLGLKLVARPDVLGAVMTLMGQ